MHVDTLFMCWLSWPAICLPSAALKKPRYLGVYHHEVRTQGLQSLPSNCRLARLWFPRGAILHSKCLVSASPKREARLWWSLCIQSFVTSNGHVAHGTKHAGFHLVSSSIFQFLRMGQKKHLTVFLPKHTRDGMTTQVAWLLLEVRLAAVDIINVFWMVWWNFRGLSENRVLPNLLVHHHCRKLELNPACLCRHDQHPFKVVNIVSGPQTTTKHMQALHS